MSDLRNWNKTK